jgi:hypothetical protein
MKKIFYFAFLTAAWATVSFAQPRPAESSGSTAKPAPPTFEAKYEGGLFGYSSKISGTLTFDDANQRLVFRDKDKKEMFAFAYEMINVVSPQSQSSTSTTGRVIQNVPLPGAGLAGLIKEKRRYLVLQFNDADADLRGSVTFKVDKKELLDSALATIAAKAGLTQRGDAYFRPRKVSSPI